MRYNTITRHGRQCPHCRRVLDADEFPAAPERIGLHAQVVVCRTCEREVHWLEQFPRGADCVYLVVSGGLWKVGHTRHLKQRLAALRNVVPTELRLVHAWMGTPAHEGRLHRELKRFRHHGEWFDLDGETVTALCARTLASEKDVRRPPPVSVIERWR